MSPSRVRIPPSPPRSTERCPSGLRSATGNRVRAERCVAGSNPALSAYLTGNVPGSNLGRPHLWDRIEAPGPRDLGADDVDRRQPFPVAQVWRPSKEMVDDLDLSAAEAAYRGNDVSQLGSGVVH